jgi:hypothetical protein
MDSTIRSEMIIYQSIIKKYKNISYILEWDIFNKIKSIFKYKMIKRWNSENIEVYSFHFHHVSLFHLFLWEKEFHADY